MGFHMCQFTPKQAYGFRIMTAGYNVFLTGDAGTGKSFLLKKYISYCEYYKMNVTVVAPTGIAALNIDGSTVHRMLGLGIHPLIASYNDVRRSEILENTDVLFLDEVSMCRLDLFDYLIMSIQKANITRNKQSKRDIQIIICGDFFQLPPVITDRDRDVLNQHYGYDIDKGFAFQSKYWNTLSLVNVVLTEIVRQQDVTFSTILNGIRTGNRNTIYTIQKMSSPRPIQGAIMLSGTNKSVNEKNTEELNKLPTQLFEYEAIQDGDVKDSDKIAPDILQVKPGARVMTLVNDSNERYRNGSFGTVDTCGPDYVIVNMDNGEKVKLRYYEWEILSYKLDKGKLNKTSVGTFKQIPLKLAYAVTIHKSQGQTYDAVNLNPYCWDCGQLYTALSRVKDVKNMYLISYLKQNYLVTSSEVKEFYRNLS